MTDVKVKVVIIDRDPELREAFTRIVDSSKDFEVAGHFESYSIAADYIRVLGKGIVWPTLPIHRLVQALPG
jgi:hypothetical protein